MPRSTSDSLLEVDGSVLLYSGVYTKIFKGKDRSTVLKVFHVGNGEDNGRKKKQIQNEIALMRTFKRNAGQGQKHVLTIEYSKEYPNFIYMEMPRALCNMQELLFDENYAETYDGIYIGERIDIARQCYLGLQYLHGLHLVHRNIKPSSILVFPDTRMRVKLSHFGYTVDSTKQPSLPLNLALGSCYTAPEVYIDFQRNTPFSDVWSMAIICIELMSGETAWNISLEDDYDDDYYSSELASHEHKLQRKVPEGLKNVVEIVRPSLTMCLDYNWDQRPTASEMVDRLCKVVSDNFDSPSHRNVQDPCIHDVGEQHPSLVDVNEAMDVDVWDSSTGSMEKVLPQSQVDNNAMTANTAECQGWDADRASTTHKQLGMLETDSLVVSKEMLDAMWKASDEFPRDANIVRMYPARDDRDVPIQPFIAVFYARINKDLRCTVAKQLTGEYELWQNCQVRYYPHRPNLEAELVLQQQTTRQKTLRQRRMKHENTKKEKSTDCCNLVLQTEEKNNKMLQIKTIINSNADVWFDAHSNLTVIKPDLLKSQGYDTKHDEMKVYTNDTPCIVFMCHKKHTIPLEEKPFPAMVDGILTDVREGMFYPLSDTQNTDRSQEGTSNTRPPSVTVPVLDMPVHVLGVSPGTSIITDSDSIGSVGGFVETIPGETTEAVKRGFLTSYHLFANFRRPDPTKGHWPEPGMASAYINETRYKSRGVSVGSLSDRDNQKVFGNYTVKGVEQGMDAAFVEFTNNVNPNPSIFADADEESFNLNEFREFEDLERIFQFSKEPKIPEYDDLIFKKGESTLLTEGELITDEMHVRWSEHLFRHADATTSSPPVCFIGKRLLSVRNIEPDFARGRRTCFADRGDSGAFAFIIREKKLHVIGIVAGRISDSTHMVIPIEPVLKYMSLALS